MARPIQLKIDVTKIDKSHLYQGQTAKYLDCAVWPNRDGADKFGFTHYITQSVSKEARDAGVKGAIIGNAKFPDDDREERPAQRRSEPGRQQSGNRMPTRPEKPQRDPDLDSDGDSIPW